MSVRPSSPSIEQHSISRDEATLLAVDISRTVIGKSILTTIRSISDTSPNNGADIRFGMGMHVDIPLEKGQLVNTWSLINS